MSQILISAVFQITAFLTVKQQAWYEVWTPNSDTCSSSKLNVTLTYNSTDIEDEKNVKNYENTTVFFISCFQYLIVAIVFSKGKPFRQPSYENYPFVVTVMVLHVFMLFIMLYPVEVIDQILELVCVPYKWRIIMLIIIVINALVSFVTEVIVLDLAPWKPLFKRNKLGVNQHAANNQQERLEQGNKSCFSSVLGGGRRKPKARYRCLARELLVDPNWPPKPKTTTEANKPSTDNSTRQILTITWH
ncbi:polyamine-transporting ATPase 13A3-like [Rhinoraja longicauda]